MSLHQPEPVEISTRMRPGEWSETSLEQLVDTYRARIVEMGASPTDIHTDVQRNDDGSVKVVVSWIKTGDMTPGGSTTTGFRDVQ